MGESLHAAGQQLHLDPSAFEHGLTGAAEATEADTGVIRELLESIRTLRLDTSAFREQLDNAVANARDSGGEIHESLHNAGRLDLDHISFDNGLHEAFSHTETEGGHIREVLEALAETATEIVGPAFAQLGQQLQSAFAGFAVGPLVGSINLVGQAVGAVREMTESTGERFHELGLAAERAGVSPTWFSQLAGVGDTVGIGVDQLSNGFRILEERAAEAGQGTKQAVEAFGNLKISLQDVASMTGDPEALFRRVQEALQGQADASLRSAYAHDVLGRAGMALVPIMRMSREEFEGVANTISDSQTERWMNTMRSSVRRLAGSRAISTPSRTASRKISPSPS